MNYRMIQHKHIVTLTMWHHLFLEFWLLNTWFLAWWCHQRAVTHLENVRQLNIRRGRKLGFKLTHTQPLKLREAKSTLMKYFHEHSLSISKIIFAFLFSVHMMMSRIFKRKYKDLERTIKITNMKKFRNLAN